MNLIIDVGNTLIKAALFEESALVKTFVLTEEAELKTIQDAFPIQKTIVSSVRKNPEKFISLTKNTLIFSSETPIPIQNNYGTPTTLGLDRLAGVIGGKTLFPNKDILTIDLGTCITYDFLQNNAYLGGAISPGIQIKFKALHTFTDKLPLVDATDQPKLIGDSTVNSILSGVINGTVSEINATIDEYKRINGNLAVILCGGDAEKIGKMVKHTITIEKNLVLIGLNEILKYNT